MVARITLKGAVKAPVYFKEWREYKKLTQPSLAEQMGTTAATVSRIETGERDWSKGFLEGFAHVIGCMPSDPITRPPGDDLDAPNRVPLVDWVSAGAPSYREGHAAYEDFPRIEAVGLGDGQWIALRVDGDSMDRISPPESVIFVDTRDKKLIPNACYVIATEQGEATYKRYRPNPDRFEPVTFNPAHEPIFPNGGVKVIGRVRRTILDL